MRVALTSLLAAASLLAAPVSNAAPPAAPALTVGADIKQLIFDWDDVAGVANYRLLYKVNAGEWKLLIDNIPAATTQAKVSIAVHLQSWSLLRYAVAACNSGGCTLSNTVFPQDLMLDAIGYFKASNADPGDMLGYGVSMSDNGRTLAVAAIGEASKAAGVNGNQTDNSSPASGAVYVFRHTSSGWRQEAYLKAGVNQPQQFFGGSFNFGHESLALNADGTLLAVGAAEQDVNGIQDTGAVYVYQRSSSGRWSLVATLTAPSPLRLELFGYSVDMSLDGRTMKINSFGTRDGPDGKPRFRTYIYVRPDTTWQYSATLTGISDDVDFCDSTRLSRDGNTVVAICDNFIPVPSIHVPFIQTFKRSGDAWVNVYGTPLNSDLAMGENFGLALDFDATTMAVQVSGAAAADVKVATYKWKGTYWASDLLQVTVALSNPLRDESKIQLALNRTGDLLAIGDPSAFQDGVGVSPNLQNGSRSVGAVYIYKRYNNWRWALRSVIKSTHPDVGNHFGSSIAMCDTGHALAVGEEGDDSGARGIDGDLSGNSAFDSGAVNLY